MPMRGLSCRFRYTISQRNLGKQMGNFFHTMRQIQRDKEQLDRNVIQALFSLPVFWLFSMLLAAGLGMGALVASAELHKRQRHLSVPVAYTHHASAELRRRQWYDEDDNLHVVGSIRTAEGKQLNLDCRNLADPLCRYDENIWQGEETLPVQSLTQAHWLNYHVITELAYTQDGSERFYRAAFSPQEETENWRLYARLWTRAATVAGAGWLGLSIAWYRRARRRKKA